MLLNRYYLLVRDTSFFAFAASNTEAYSSLSSCSLHSNVISTEDSFKDFEAGSVLENEGGPISQAAPLFSPTKLDSSVLNRQIFC